ncbi:MAG: hypothetical protein ACI9EZ_001765, partial [Halobacteriales archaeon]
FAGRCMEETAAHGFDSWRLVGNMAAATVIGQSSP